MKDSPIATGATTPFVRRVTIRNYKSIAACQVELQRLLFLVGPNGAGKSNFLDALRFVADALRTSLDHALRDRGTIKEVRRRSGGHPNHFAIRLDFVLSDGSAGHYSFRVGSKPAGGYEVQSEECKLIAEGFPARSSSYHVKSGQVIQSSEPLLPAVLPDRLFLVAASGLPAFRPVFDALSRIEIYNLNPKVIAIPQLPDPSELLRRDGSNAASMLQKLAEDERQQISRYLSRIVPGISAVDAKSLGAQETIEFRQSVRGQEHPWRFLASSMSDGTLRAFGVLLALFQSDHTLREQSPLLIGLEEPEMALHPAAASVLLAALRDASQRVQILVTSHSPDLLDNPDIETESLLAVENDDALTHIAPIDAAGREMLRQKLFTAGELLRQNQLAPDAAGIADVQSERQLNLFELGGR